MASNGAARAALGEGRTIYNEVLGGLPTTVFEKMSLLAAKHKSINLGQGFPDRELEGPASMKDEAYRCVARGARVGDEDEAAGRGS